MEYKDVGPLEGQNRMWFPETGEEGEGRWSVDTE